MNYLENEYQSLWLDLAGAPFEQSYINAGGIRTRILSAGSREKPLLLFLHGTGGHGEAYSRNLAAHAEHFWVVAVDAIGHGWTDKPEIEYEIPAYSDHVLKVLSALGREKALISGESLGGWTATYLAIHHPDVVQRLVLNTAGGWTAHPPVMARIKELSLAVAQNPTYEAMRARLEFLMYDKSKVNDDLVYSRLNIYRQPGFFETTQRILCLQEMPIRRRNMFSVADYARINCPTLVLWTTHDPTASVEEGAELASMISNSQFVVMENCGHWPQFEEPNQFNDIHIEFLRR